MGDNADLHDMSGDEEMLDISDDNIARTRLMGYSWRSLVCTGARWWQLVAG